MNDMRNTIDDARTARLGAIERRDAGQDGAFVYGVTSTGIYCRPSCPSRKPKPANIRLFDLPEAARQAGFRACKRCQPDLVQPSDPRLAAMRRACAAIDAHLAAGEEGPPQLRKIARAAGLSPAHLQRSFTQLLGISPRAYADAQRVGLLKKGLRAGHGVADAVFGAAFGSTSRVYERAPRLLGMTPATYAKGGAGVELTYAFGSSAFGLLLVAATGKGIAALYLGDSEKKLLGELKHEFPAAVLHGDAGPLGKQVKAILSFLSGKLPHLDLPLDVRATAFQWRVWQELRQIPRGETRTYSEVAVAIGQPRAVRAVGHACATNPVSILVPCHRVLRTDVSLGGYRWGLKRKAALLEREKG